jgi:C4-dicarboxylate-specific signal transduction histidine kinase
MGHNGQLQEVIVNLIQNAVDAMDSTDTDRRVLQVRTEHNGDAISVDIVDTGPGVDPKKSDNIFDAFLRQSYQIFTEVYPRCFLKGIKPLHPSKT